MPGGFSIENPEMRRKNRISRPVCAYSLYIREGLGLKILILGRKQLGIIGLALVLAVAVAFACFWRADVVAAERAQKLLPVYCVETDQKICAISFDAAWGNEDTEQLIEILDRYKVKTTFFVVGDWVRKYPESVKALSDAGHEIMNHSSTHPHMPKLGREEMQKELSECNDLIKAITGVSPTLHRPPYGEYSNALIEVLASMNMTGVQWDVDILDIKITPY